MAKIRFMGDRDPHQQRRDIPVVCCGPIRDKLAQDMCAVADPRYSNRNSLSYRSRIAQGRILKMEK